MSASTEREYPIVPKPTGEVVAVWARIDSGARPAGAGQRRQGTARRQLFVAGCAVFAASFLAASPEAGADGGLTNVAAASATAQVPVVTRSAWSLQQTQSPTIAAENVATATASDCTGCQAAAVAFQVVLASEASVLEPSNLATATESSCTACSAVAVADQWVVADFDGRIALTLKGRYALEGVRLQLLALQQRRASGQDVTAATAQLASQVDDVLTHDVVVEPPEPWQTPAGGAGGGGWKLRRRPSGRLGRSHLGARTSAGGGRSVSVLPENGYTIYVYAQQDTGNGAASSDG